MAAIFNNCVAAHRCAIDNPQVCHGAVHLSIGPLRDMNPWPASWYVFSISKNMIYLDNFNALSVWHKIEKVANCCILD